MKLKDVPTKGVTVTDQRPGAKVKYSTPVEAKPVPLKPKSPAEVRNNTARNNFYRSARTPGLGN